MTLLLNVRRLNIHMCVRMRAMLLRDVSRLSKVIVSGGLHLLCVKENNSAADSKNTTI